MDTFCKKQYIFFNENDRIKYSIKKSKGLFQEFKGTLNRGFKNIHTFEDHPKLKLLLEEEQKEIPGQAAKSGAAGPTMSPRDTQTSLNFGFQKDAKKGKGKKLCKDLAQTGTSFAAGPEVSMTSAVTKNRGSK